MFLILSMSVRGIKLLFRCTHFISPTHKEGCGGKKADLVASLGGLLTPRYLLVEHVVAIFHI